MIIVFVIGFVFKNKTLQKGLSINDVTVLGRGSQGFYDDNIKAFVINSVTMGGGEKGG